jgi:hypothetical protein
MEEAMEFAIRLFFILFFAAFKRYWYVVCIPLLAMAVYGAYTGSWYIWSSVIASSIIAAVIAIGAMKEPM